MSVTFWAFSVSAFLTVVLLFWGIYSAWIGTMDSSTKVMAQRLQSLSPKNEPGHLLQVNQKRMLSRYPWLDQLLRQVPGTQAFDRFLLQTGIPMRVDESALTALALLVTIGIASSFFHLGWARTVVLMCMGLLLPLWMMQYKRRQRIVQIESHLPDVLDLIARSMQAGHAFTSALLMAANDTRPPLSAELHKVFDQIHFGLELRQAMSEMAARVASDDLRFFVISVLVQHETGGNLAEILKNTATLIRERQKIRGVIRVLSGEGRVSAWILSLLPFALAAVLNMLNPGFISALWTEPQGLQMLYVCLVLMVLGIAWMWRLIDIRI